MTYNVTLHMTDGRYLTTIIDGVRYPEDAYDRAVEYFDVAYAEVDFYDADAI